MKYFLLDYNHDTGEVSITPIEDTAEALAAYSEREREALGTSHEVVLFYGDSEDDLRKTHSRYFLGSSERADGEALHSVPASYLEELQTLIERAASRGAQTSTPA